MGLTAAVTVLLPLIANSELFRDRLAEAVKKLKDQAQATRESDAAQRMFDNTLEGAIAKQRKMNTELEKELSTRQKINKIKVAEAGQGVATAKANLDAARNLSLIHISPHEFWAAFEGFERFHCAKG